VFSSRVGVGRLFCGFIYGLDKEISLFMCSTATETVDLEWILMRAQYTRRRRMGY
jgi:hypothetical protein